jgi:hypothetical protein
MQNARFKLSFGACSKENIHNLKIEDFVEREREREFRPRFTLLCMIINFTKLFHDCRNELSSSIKEKYYEKNSAIRKKNR